MTREVQLFGDIKEIKMGNGITNEIIGLIGALSAAIITAVVGIITFKLESRAKRVTEERVKWLNIVRADYSIIMAAYELKKSSINNFRELKVNKEDYDKIMFEAEKARYDLISRLNTNTYEGNEYNYPIKHVLLKMKFVVAMDFNSDKPMVNNNDIEKLMKYMNLMLEREWNKSKKEI